MTVDGASPLIRCGINAVEIARVERLLLGTPPEDLAGPPASARFAAKEAGLKLFPRETALGLIGPADVAVASDGHGAPPVVYGPDALE